MVNVKRHLIKVVKAVFLILVLYFLWKYIKGNIDDLKQVKFTIDIGLLLLSVLIFVVYKVNLCLLWHLITIKNNGAISLQKAFVSWFYSLLGKYIPGKVFFLGARLYYYHQEGVSKKNITFCFLLENICTLLGAAFLFIVSLLFIPNPVLQQYRLAVLLLLAAFFIGVHPAVLDWVLNLPLRLLKKKTMKLEIRYRDILQLVLLFIINWLIVGIGFYVLVHSFYPIELKFIFYVSGAFGLSIIIGILSLFAPSGIGVREGVMIFALSLIMPESAAVVVSIISRLWMTFTELFLVAVVFIYAKLKRISFSLEKTKELAKDQKKDEPESDGI
jgi:uncharacterized membrane protein YbhN (UPF0104 family)